MTDVTTRSRKSRSWLTSSTVPGYSASRSCNRSRVSRSRSLVVSSSHQQVGWPGEGPSKGKPGALAAGEHADRSAGLVGAEQEILHVADHMAALAADRHGVAAAASKCLSQALFRVEGFAALIENYRGEIGAEPKCNRRGSAPGTVRFEMSAYQLAIGGKADPIRLNEVFNPRQLALPASSSSGLKV